GLAYLYASGRGVPQDYVQAYKWYGLAVLNRDNTNREFDAQDLDSLTAKMTPQQIAEGKKLVPALKPQELTAGNALPAKGNQTTQNVQTAAKTEAAPSKTAAPPESLNAQAALAKVNARTTPDRVAELAWSAVTISCKRPEFPTPSVFFAYTET